MPLILIERVVGHEECVRDVVGFRILNITLFIETGECRFDALPTRESDAFDTAPIAIFDQDLTSNVIGFGGCGLLSTDLAYFTDVVHHALFPSRLPLAITLRRARKRQHSEHRKRQHDYCIFILHTKKVPALSQVRTSLSP